MIGRRLMWKKRKTQKKGQEARWKRIRHGRALFTDTSYPVLTGNPVSLTYASIEEAVTLVRAQYGLRGEPILWCNCVSELAMTPQETLEKLIQSRQEAFKALRDGPPVEDADTFSRGGVFLDESRMVCIAGYWFWMGCTHGNEELQARIEELEEENALMRIEAALKDYEESQVDGIS